VSDMSGLTLDAQCRAAISEFNDRRGNPRRSFPIDLELCIALALPLFVVSVPSLSLLEMRDWIVARGRNLPVDLFTDENRRLRASVIAAAGVGIIFVDASDPKEERRFSLAHELVAGSLAAASQTELIQP
jgi:hypothetical protein